MAEIDSEKAEIKARAQADGTDGNILHAGRRATVTPAQDAAYLAAVKVGDMETAQRMVDEAAKEAGYETKDYWRAVQRDGKRGELDLAKTAMSRTMWMPPETINRDSTTRFIASTSKRVKF